MSLRSHAPLVKTMLHSLKTWKTLISTLHGDAGFFIACGHTIFINLVFSLWFSLSLTRRNLFIWFRDKGRFKSLFWNCIYTSINGHLSVCIYGIDCNLKIMSSASIGREKQIIQNNADVPIHRFHTESDFSNVSFSNLCIKMVDSITAITITVERYNIKLRDFQQHNKRRFSYPCKMRKLWE